MAGLFKVDDKKVVNGVELNVLSLNSESLFWEYLKNNDYTCISYNNSFMMLYPYHIANNECIFYVEMNEHLFIFEYLPKQKRYILRQTPISKDGVYDSESVYGIHKAVVMLNKLNGTKISYIEYAVGDMSTIFNKDKVAYIGELYPQFIFEAQTLIELKGKKFKSRRNLINQFTSENDFTFRPYEKSDYDGVMRVYELWAEEFVERQEENDRDTEIYYKGILDVVLEMTGKLDYRPYVMEIDGTIEAIYVICKHCKDTSSVFIGYANNEIKGLPEYMWYNILKENQDLGKYENDGTGSEPDCGLYFYKMKHQPIHLLVGSEIKINKNGESIKNSIFL